MITAVLSEVAQELLNFFCRFLSFVSSDKLCFYVVVERKVVCSPVEVIKSVSE
jgi:hypothetical protein